MADVPVFVINLEKDVNKKSHIDCLSRKYGIEVYYIEAVYGKSLSKEEVAAVYDKGRAIREVGRPLSPAEIGCALSHMEIYKKMMREKIERAIVLEDDVRFNKDLNLFIDSIGRLSADWELVLLCYYRESAFVRKYCLSYRNRRKINSAQVQVRFIEPMHSTAGYIVNLSGAKKLLTALEVGICKPIDHYTGDERHVNLYGVHPRPVVVDEVLGQQSTIAADRAMASNRVGGDSDDWFRVLLKRIGFFGAFKAMNMFRQRKQVPLVQFAYCLTRVVPCFRRPKRYDIFE